MAKATELVRRYAVTLLEAAEETGVTEDVRRDLEGLAATLRASAELREFLGNRLVDGPAASKALEALLAGKVQPLTLNFVRLVAGRRRGHALADMVGAALAMLDERAGIDTAEVRSAAPLTPGQVEALGRRLSGYTGRKVSVRAEVDESLRGGLVARVGDTVFDASVDTQLRRLRERLVSA